MDTLGARIRNKRLEKGLTQKQLGNLVYVSRDYISKLENNKLKGSKEVLELITKRLGIRYWIRLRFKRRRRASNDTH